MWIRTWWQYATRAERAVMTFNTVAIVGSVVAFYGALRDWWW